MRCVCRACSAAASSALHLDEKASSAADRRNACTSASSRSSHEIVPERLSTTPPWLSAPREHPSPWPCPCPSPCPCACPCACPCRFVGSSAAMAAILLALLIMLPLPTLEPVHCSGAGAPKSEASSGVHASGRDWGERIDKVGAGA
eukprot:5801491-Pleurochrysis_carterae.AAC.1